jgi:hypothetical protein
MKAKTTQPLKSFGFMHPFDLVETLYWAWRSSDWKNLPDPGGTLDQDRLLMEDMLTYHVLISAAEDEVEGRVAPVVEDEPLYHNLPSSGRRQRRHGHTG